MKDDPRADGPGRREQRRRTINQQFVVRHKAFGSQTCFSRDLSLSGVFLSGQFDGVQPGDTMDIEFSMAISPETVFRFSASVARVEQGGVGLKFLSLDMDTYGALLDLTMTG